MTEDYLNAPNAYLEDGPPLETAYMPPARIHKQQAKNRYLAELKKEHLAALMPTRPEKGYVYHIVNNGRSDYWTWVAHMLTWLNGPASDLYVSTWTINRHAVTELAQLMDQGRILRASFLTGIFFKRRETSIYAQLLETLASRGGRFVAFENHAKVLLLKSASLPHHHLVCEGSANMHSNPRLEQSTITDDQALYEFHKGWMEEALTHG